VIGGFIAIFAAISLILGVISLALTWGLFQLKSWAWTGTLIVHVIATLAQLAKMLGTAGTAANFLTLGFAIATIYYLLRSEVKQAFTIAPSATLFDYSLLTCPQLTDNQRLSNIKKVP